jgi:hypothetical protein
MNFVILFALIIQSAIAKSSHKGGAIVGYLIITGILLWGLSVYAAGGFITLFTFPLSKSFFMGACIFWYLANTKELFKGGAIENTTGE